MKSYGKLQVTLITGGSINETFTMTKKDDEELLVGAILQKIVVPHPTLSNLDAIEVYDLEIGLIIRLYMHRKLFYIIIY